MTAAERVDAIVIGAGVVGLAIGRALAARGHWTIVLEAEDAIGTGISSRNSEIIHAGIYYPTGSLKARACVRGKELLYAYAAEKGFTAEAIGKLIVANGADEIEALERLYETGKSNDVKGLSLINRSRITDLEPNVSADRAIWSTTTGIVDSHAFMLALQGDLEEAGGMVALHAPFERAEALRSGFRIETGGPHPMRFECDILVNASGLFAPDIARRIEGLDPVSVPPGYLAKGNYFALAGVRPPFSRLIYPMPNEAGLGIHATIDLGRQVRFGPDVEWVNDLDFAPRASRLGDFEDAIRRYYPGLPASTLTPVYAGIRPKIVGPGEPPADFRVDGAKTHGIQGLVNLFGIESPGLTSALALADDVVSKL